MNALRLIAAPFVLVASAIYLVVVGLLAILWLALPFGSDLKKDLE